MDNFCSSMCYGKKLSRGSEGAQRRCWEFFLRRWYLCRDLNSEVGNKKLEEKSFFWQKEGQGEGVGIYNF